jgi:formylglycine-generating enzyme required for sulfatase activity
MAQAPTVATGALSLPGLTFRATFYLYRGPCPAVGHEEDPGPTLLATQRVDGVEPGQNVTFDVYVPTHRMVAPPGPTRTCCARVVYAARWWGSNVATVDAWRAAPSPRDGLRVAHQDKDHLTLAPYMPVKLKLGPLQDGRDGHHMDVYDEDGDRVPNLVEVELGLRPTDADTMEPPVDLVTVDGATFDLGADLGVDRDALPNESPPAPVTVGRLRVDSVEVTNRAYRVCMGRVRDDGTGPTCQDPWAALGEERPNRVFSAGSDLLPVVGLSRAQAGSFCAARGMRLPTEAEWERLARVAPGGELLKYPWGDNDPELVDGVNPCALGRFTLYDDGGNFPRFCQDRPFEVGPVLAPGGGFLRVPGSHGLYDLAGNAAEWTADRYDDELHERILGTATTGPPSGNAYTVRGGSFWSGPRFVRGYARAVVDQDTLLSDENTRAQVLSAVGVRCVVDAP